MGKIGRDALLAAALVCAAASWATAADLDEPTSAARDEPTAAAGDEPTAAAPDAPTASPPRIDVRSVDRAGIRRDTAYFLGYQFVAVATISLWPQEDTGYSKEIGFDRWLYNVTNPHWDSDGPFVNLVLHPYWGAGYYIRARERGLDRTDSFWYSTLLSSIFEFGAEAMVERVSLQDLVITPVLGSLLGEYVFSPLRDHLRAKEELSALEQVAWVLTDPLGSINSAVDRMLGIKTQVTLQPMMSSARSRHRTDHGPVHASPRERIGWRLQVQIPW